MTINAQDIAQRIPIWLALSALYLDTELQDYNYRSIAKSIHESGLSLKQIRRIDCHEVHPVLGPNLYSVAGVWDDFDEQWLIQKCTQRYHKRNNRWASLKARLFYRLSQKLLSEDWSAIEMNLQQLSHTQTSQ